MKQKIFVYGTLRKGMYNYDIYLRDEDSFRRYGYIKGSLMTLKDKTYPAFLQEGHDMILGEIHEVNEKTVQMIDELEEYYGEGNIDNFYNKEICDIYDENGQVIDHLPVYVFNMSNRCYFSLIEDHIETNDYVKYIQQKKEGKKSLLDFEIIEEE